MDVLDILQRITTTLEELKIPYMISGSAASSFHSLVRTTHDGDLVISLPPDRVEAFASAFAAEFYLDRDSIRRALQLEQPFNLVHLESFLKIDFFPLRKRSFSQQEFSRRQPRLQLKDGALPAFVAAAEDVILSKLEWFRAGGEVSENQWKDVLAILKVQAGSLDLPYMKKWAGELHVGDLLERALEEAERRS